MEDPAAISQSSVDSPVKPGEDEQETSHPNEETLREKEDDDEHMSEDREADENDPTKDALLGGNIQTPAFCLLDGFFEDPDTAKKTRLTLPIDRLPATLGRTHHTEETNFFGLGKVKALSRQQCSIDYRTSTGKLLQGNNSDNFTHKEENVKQKVLNPDNDTMADSGFFVITCLGKNRIFVNGHKVEQGQTALLPSGAAIRISAFSLYILLPNRPSNKTMEIAVKSKKRKKATSSAADDKPAPKRAKSGAAKSWPTLQSELDSMSTEDLLEQITTAIDNDAWDRRSQLVGSTLSYRAILAAAKDPEIQSIAKNGGVSRGKIMEWISDSDQFGDWVQQMLTKLFAKSYQASITKAMIKANFERTGSTGRYIKWIIPSALMEGGEERRSKSSGEAAKPKQEEDRSNVQNEASQDSDEDKDMDQEHDGGDGEDEEADDGEKDSEKEKVGQEGVSGHKNDPDGKDENTTAFDTPAEKPEGDGQSVSGVMDG